MKLAGIEPDGFVAPAYAYTAALRQALRRRFRWWADLLRVHRAADEDGRAPASDLARARLQLRRRRARSAGCSRRRWSAPARCCRPPRCAWTCIPPTCATPRHMMALEWVLQRSRCREAVTYGELARV